jgi:hypothetical protein
MHAAIQIILAVFIADMMTGLGHFIEDNYLPYCTAIPFISIIAKHNELHHYLPRAMLLYSLSENTITLIPIVVFFACILYLIAPTLFTAQYFPFTCTLLILLLFSNVLHRVNHLQDCEAPILVKFLRAIYILAPREDHVLHHKNSTLRYCQIIPYNNYWMDAIGFWAGINHAVYFLTGVRAEHKPGYDGYGADMRTELHDENDAGPCPRIITKKEEAHLFAKLDNHYRCV